MSILPLPKLILDSAVPAMEELATALVAEGARGAAARRAFARDIALRRARLRALEGVQAALFAHLTSDPHALAKATQLDRLIEAEHRRFLASIAALAALDPQPAHVHVHARQAAVVVGR